MHTQILTEMAEWINAMTNCSHHFSFHGRNEVEYRFVVSYFHTHWSRLDERSHTLSEPSLGTTMVDRIKSDFLLP